MLLFLGIYLGNSSVGWGQYSLISNETWTSATIMSTKTNYKNGIIIGGFTLTINGTPLDAGAAIALNTGKEINISGGSLLLNGTTLTFNNNCRIFVTGGGQLLSSNNSILKHINGDGNFWDGINASHTYGADQFLVYPTADPNSTTCTNSEWEGILNSAITLVNISSTTIENATIGILSDGDEVHGTFGGAVVRVRNSFFNNCEKGIKIINGSSLVKRFMCGSFIMRTDFNWTDITNMTKSNLIHVELRKTRGLNIGGCKFKNSDIVKRCSNDKGIGISANKSEIFIKSDGNSCCKDALDEGSCPDNCYNPVSLTKRRNEFEKLGIGLNFETGYSDLKLVCKKSDFINCADGIKVFNGKEINLGQNNFTSSTSVYNNLFTSSGCANYVQMTGIFCSESSGVNVFKNTFNTDLSQFHLIEFQYPDNTYKSSIKNNTFTSTYTLLDCGENTQAIVLSGDNDNLDITCNVFTNIGYDIFINIDGYIYDIPDMSSHQQNTSYKCISAQNQYSTITLNCYHNITNNHPNYTTYVGYRTGFSNPVTNGLVIKNPTFQFSPPAYEEYTPGQLPSFVKCAFTCTNLERKVAVPKRLSIENFNNSIKFNVFPNPTSNNIFNIEIPDFNINYTISVFDINGKQVFTQAITVNATAVNLENMPKGIYAVQINGANSSNTKLIVLQ